MRSQKAGHGFEIGRRSEGVRNAAGGKIEYGRPWWTPPALARLVGRSVGARRCPSYWPDAPFKCSHEPIPA